MTSLAQADASTPGPIAPVQPDTGCGGSLLDGGWERRMGEVIEKRISRSDPRLREQYAGLLFRPPSFDPPVYDLATPRLPPDRSTLARRAAVDLEDIIRFDEAEPGAFLMWQAPCCCAAPESPIVSVSPVRS